MIRQNCFTVAILCSRSFYWHCVVMWYMWTFWEGHQNPVSSFLAVAWFTWKSHHDFHRISCIRWVWAAVLYNQGSGPKNPSYWARSSKGTSPYPLCVRYRLCEIPMKLVTCFDRQYLLPACLPFSPPWYNKTTGNYLSLADSRSRMGRS